MKIRRSIILSILTTTLFFPKLLQAYVNIEDAQFWHFLVSRYGQLHAPPRAYTLAKPGVDRVGAMIKSPRGKKLFLRYGKELAPHLGWRLGCNIGWEVAGAALMLRDHRSVNLETVLKDSVLTPGLLLYPFGQVAGQHIGGDLVLKALNRLPKRTLSPNLSALLVEEGGVPNVWGPATVQKAASRIVGLAIGVYLAWSLFDLGHSLAYGGLEDPLDAFRWNRDQILGMAGFTYGGYLGHNVGYTLAHRHIVPKMLASTWYDRLASRATLWTGEGMKGSSLLGKLHPRHIRLGLGEGILNKEGLLWRGSAWMAMPVNALFCIIMAMGLPAAVNAFEDWRIEEEWEQELPDPPPETKPEPNDALIAAVDQRLEESIAALTTSVAEEAEMPEAAETLGQHLRGGKSLMVDIGVVMAASLKNLQEVARAKIYDIATPADSLGFSREELLPLFDMGEHADFFDEQLTQYFQEAGTVGELKGRFHEVVDVVLPRLYLQKVVEHVERQGEDA